ncbi:SDR family oxidoreductase [Vibrio ostreicida]|uniref:SDR family oxidoreductase n=1 Tax=Vibrio ostreicida TaxID=526588 RepID=UPI00097067DE|nr:SDR family oxidoreductase [Vibrio ostreicida]
MKTVLITGANRGIGLSLVKQYLKTGWHVHATYRSELEAADLLSISGKSLTCHQLDVTDYPAMDCLAKTLPPLDVLINNAGYYGPKGKSFGTTDVEQWRKVLEVNTIAPLKLVEALYTKLQQGSIKKIACLSSKVGSITENTSGGGYIYRSSKAALNSVVKSLSNDLSPQGFTVLALHPGWVLTDMGGPNALIEAQVSATGLIQVIDGAKDHQSGAFLNYDGTSLPW